MDKSAFVHLLNAVTNFFSVCVGLMHVLCMLIPKHVVEYVSVTINVIGNLRWGQPNLGVNNYAVILIYILNARNNLLRCAGTLGQFDLQLFLGAKLHKCALNAMDSPPWKCPVSPDEAVNVSLQCLT